MTRLLRFRSGSKSSSTDGSTGAGDDGMSQRAVYLPVVHRLFASGSNQAAKVWKKNYRMPGTATALDSPLTANPLFALNQNTKYPQTLLNHRRFLPERARQSTGLVVEC